MPRASANWLAAARLAVARRARAMAPGALFFAWSIARRYRFAYSSEYFR